MRSLTELLRLRMLFFFMAFAFPAIASSPLSVDTDGDGIEDSQDADDDGDGVLDEADFDPVNFFLRKDTDCDGLANYYDTDKDNDGLFDSERLQILGRNTTGGGSGVRLKLAADVPDGQLNLNFRIDASEWVHKEDHQGKEFDNGVCGQCSCIECGKRLDHDDLNEDTCEHCSEIENIKFDRRDSEGFCNWCDKEMATKRYVDKDGMGLNLCNACYKNFDS